MKGQIGMMKIYNKRGDVAFRSIMFAFVKFVIVILVLFTLIFFIRKFVFFDADTGELESEVFVNSIMRSPHGPSYFDKDTGRVYPFVVDINFFTGNKGNLKKAFNYSEKYIAAKISLNNKNGKSTIEGEEISPVYYNKKKFDVWKEIADMKFGRPGNDKGPGDVKDFKKRYYVNIKTDNERVPGFIDIKVLMLKS